MWGQNEKQALTLVQHFLRENPNSVYALAGPGIGNTRLQIPSFLINAYKGKLNDFLLTKKEAIQEFTENVFPDSRVVRLSTHGIELEEILTGNKLETHVVFLIHEVIFWK